MRLDSGDPGAAGSLIPRICCEGEAFYVVWYVFAVCVLGLHVSHGVQSSFRSLGLVHSKYTPLVEKLGTLFAVIVAVGYASLPVYAYFFLGAAS